MVVFIYLTLSAGMYNSRPYIIYYQKDFEKIFTIHYKSLCLFANSYVKSLTVAEDIVQESFTKLWEIRNDIRDESAIYSWLCSTVKNKAVNILRAQKNLTNKRENIVLAQSLENNSDQLDRMMRAELVTELHRLIHDLPPQCSKVLSSLYIDDKSVAETAAELQVSINTVKSHKARGIELLRHKLRPLLLVWLLSL